MNTASLCFLPCWHASSQWTIHQKNLYIQKKKKKKPKQVIFNNLFKIVLTLLYFPDGITAIFQIHCLITSTVQYICSIRFRAVHSLRSFLWTIWPTMTSSKKIYFLYKYICKALSFWGHKFLYVSNNELY